MPETKGTKRYRLWPRKRASGKRDPLGWLHDINLSDHGRIVPLGGMSAMAKFPQGAVLNWVFDQPDDETEYRLVVYLTDAESQKVYDAPSDVGMLEPVRSSMAHPGAMLVVVRSNGLEPATAESRRYFVPASGNEYEFVTALTFAAQSISEYNEMLAESMTTELAYWKRHRDEARSEIENAQRALAALNVEAEEENRRLTAAALRFSFA
ncbi:hypothetical protein ACWDO0_28565 [Nocardia rhamnosiphila]